MEESTIWTRAYRPWIMGGDVNAPIMTKVPVLGPFRLGKEYAGYVAMSPAGECLIIESTTGAVVGNSLEEVRQDILEADPEVIRLQLEDAKIQRERADYVTPETFWSMRKGTL